MHDDELSRQIFAATEQVERDTDRAVITQSFALLRDYFPCAREAIRLSKSPASAVTTITYTDADGASQPMDPADYIVDLPRREVALAPGASWPTTNRSRNNVRVEFDAGYTSPATVPRKIIEAVLCWTAYLFYGNSPDADSYLKAYDRLIDQILRTSYP